MNKLKIAAIVAALSLPLAATAGNLDVPLMEESVIVESSSATSSSTVVVPLLILAVLAAAIAN